MLDRRKLFSVLAALALILTGCTGALRPASPTVELPTAAPVVIATAMPTDLPTPIPPAPTSTPVPRAKPQRPLYVAGTGGQGLALRTEPSTTAERIDLLPDGTELFPSGEEQPGGGHLWRQVRDKEGRDGWVAAEFLTDTAPGDSMAAAATSTSQAMTSPSPEPVAQVTATPSWPVTLIPTATLAPPQTARPPTAQPPTRPPVSSPSPIVPVILSPPASKPAPPASQPAPPAGQPVPGAACHPSYPDFCIPPPPPDLNCSSSEIGDRRGFRIVGPDVHRLDQGGQPGVACDG